MTRQVTVSAPSRLHFGLLRFGQSEDRSFGGLGLMIAQPRIELRVSAAEQWTATGPLRERALRVAKFTAAVVVGNGSQTLAIEVTAAPPEHVGLGVGTQLSLAVAAAVQVAHGVQIPRAEGLSALIQRGQRSAVGTYGFGLGGLILENGFGPTESMGRLLSRTAIPKDWRFVLLRLPTTRGKCGVDEQAAFNQLPPVPSHVTRELLRLAAEEIIPAAERSACDDFGRSLYEYGILAGECFAPVQGGPFASPEISAAVERLRSMGVAGAGQSSWGPTVFAVVASQTAAEALLEECRRDPLLAHAEASIAAADDDGAMIKRSD